MSTALFWFRNDLRCVDNPALALACQNHQKLIPIYVKELNPSVPLGGAQHWWLHHSLNSLKTALLTNKLDLYLRQDNPLALFKKLIKEYSIEAIYWNRCYEPQVIARDQVIKSELKALGVKVISCNGSLLNEPWELSTQNGGYYKVFTPYWRQSLSQMNIRPPATISQWPLLQPIPSDSLDDWKLLPKNPNWASEFSAHWEPGEAGALKKLNQFLTHSLDTYKISRNLPARNGTSRLSPHLHFGELSPNYMWSVLQQAMIKPGISSDSIQSYLTELGWREFSYHLLYHVPNLMDSNFKAVFNTFPWEQNQVALKQWQKGLTGYPIVDAGMRELWRTGYMHNRVRMIVASFLTKDLMIDWRQGAAWFWDTLLDADLANNSASWQWVAGSGADAAPYYRIFNPVLQGEKFDASGEYVKRWVPELANVPTKWIHKPWEAPREAIPLVLGEEYPNPIVNHALARQRALAAYKALK